MMNGPITNLVLAGVLLLIVAPVAAQKGMGDPAGIARQGLQPEIVTFTGTLKEVLTGPCESTTGHYVTGTHLIIETEDGHELNVHLGAAGPLSELTSRLSLGQTLSFEAFQTDQMPEDAYVAKSVTVGEDVVQLRDASLRPTWAGSAFRGQGNRGRGRGMRGL
jgi:hypothetical protein